MQVRAQEKEGNESKDGAPKVIHIATRFVELDPTQVRLRVQFIEAPSGSLPARPKDKAPAKPAISVEAVLIKEEVVDLLKRAEKTKGVNLLKLAHGHHALRTARDH